MLLQLWLVALVAGPLQIRGVDGKGWRPLEPSGVANVLLFVATDCPISNGYAPEIQRICRAYAAKGIACSLVYEDSAVTDADVRKHLADYRYGSMPAAIDRDGSLAARLGATVTPEVIVVDHHGATRYRGRIDNLYAALGHPRRVVTSHDLAGALDALVAGKRVPTPETDALGCYIAPSDARSK